MAIDVSTFHRLDDILKRLEAYPDMLALIEKLAEDREMLDLFKELTGDREMLGLLKRLNVPNSDPAAGQSQAAQHSHKRRRKKRMALVRGVMTKEIGNLVATLSETFTVRMIIETLEERGFEFRSTNPIVAVNDILKLLTERGAIRVVKQGAGRTPSEYERVQT